MSSGETLLKITDFPFAYSLISVLFVALGMNVHDTKFIAELGIAGALGTFLTITDPVGRLLKFLLKYNMKKFENVTFEVIDPISNLDYAIRSLGTRSIGIEIDKIVSLIYFAFLLAFISVSVMLSSHFDSILNIENNKQILIDAENAKYTIMIASSIVIIMLIVVSIKNRKDLIRHIHTEGVRQYGISSEFSMPNTIENISKAIDQNDWQTAEEWQRVLLKEIKTQKGKKDVLVKSIEIVYRPLYTEMMSIESIRNLINIDGNFRKFPDQEWMKIKSTPEFHMIDIKEREEIQSFYGAIEEYNKIVEVSNNIASKILKQRIENDYGRDYTEIRYWVESTRGMQAPSLQALMLTGMHPMAQFPSETKPHLDRIETVNNRGNGDVYKNQEDIEKFNAFWDRLVRDADNDSEIKRMKGYFRDISNKSEDLRSFYLQKIEEQWDK